MNPSTFSNSPPDLPHYQGISSTACLSHLPLPNPTSSSSSSSHPLSPNLTLTLRNTNFPIPQTLPASTVPIIPVGASTNPAPLTIVPTAPAPIVATSDPIATYLAYRTSRQNRNMNEERTTRRSARVRREEIWEEEVGVGEMR